MSVLPIAGVTLEQYARLCAAMADTGGDEAKEIEIAAAAGVSADAWRHAKAGFTAKMQDPVDAGQTAMAFMPLYQAAQAELRGGGPPCSLALYAEISTSYSFEQDALGNQVPPELIFQRHGITAAKWNEYTSYWTPRVNDPTDPAAAEFRVLVQAESDRIFGIHRDARGSRVDPDDEDASPADRAAAQAALANARRPVDGNPHAVSPGAGPVRTASPRPVAPAAPPPAAAPAAPPPSAAPPPPPAAKAVKVAPAAPPPVADAPRPAAPTPEPPPETPVARMASDKKADEEERMFAAACHLGVVVGFAGFAPLVIWLLKKDSSEFLAWKAREAMIVQFAALVAVIALSIVTCGFGSMLLLPWFGLEVYLAWKAWEGSREGYPVVGQWVPK